jgi:hypothetical protein
MKEKQKYRVYAVSNLRKMNDRNAFFTPSFSLSFRSFRWVIEKKNQSINTHLGCQKLWFVIINNNLPFLFFLSQLFLESL